MKTERTALVIAVSLGLLLLFVTMGPAEAQDALTKGALRDVTGLTSSRIIQLVGLLTILSLAPGIMVTVTCFTRFVIALSFLRSGLGLPSTPSNIILVSLALFMSFYVMAPTLERMWIDGIKPLSDNIIDETEAYKRAAKPLREFMLAHVRQKDLQLFQSLAKRRDGTGEPQAQTVKGDLVDDVVDDMRIIVPAFMISELRRGFEMGVLILLPFLIIDLVVSIVVMSLGMMMLQPTTISLPFKLLFFVLIDGWNLVVGSLIRSYGQ